MFLEGTLILMNVMISFIFAIPYDNLSTSSATNNSSNPLDSNCDCDLTADTCDPFCCCDPQCSEVVNGNAGNHYWVTYGLCISQQNDTVCAYFAECENTNYTSTEADLYQPIRVFYQNLRRGLCLVYNNNPDLNLTSNNTQAGTVKNSTQFTDLIKQYYNVSSLSDETYYYMSNTFVNNIPSLYSANFTMTNYTGYQSNDPLIWLNSLASDAKTNPVYNTITFPIANPYGRCKNGMEPIRYLRNNKIICAQKLIINSASTSTSSTSGSLCADYNKNNFIAIETSLSPTFQVLSYNYTTNTTSYVSPKLKGIYKVANKISYAELSDTSIEGISSESGPVNSQCTCSNIVTSAEHNLLMNNATIVGYETTYYVEDITGGCSGAAVNVPVTYSVNFINQDTSNTTYTRSGNPGYIKGKPLITGIGANVTEYNSVTNTNTTSNYVEQFTNPRVIFGIGLSESDRGLCYYSNLLSGVDSTGDVIPYLDLTSLEDTTSSVMGIYQSQTVDNSLTWENGISWGCVDTLNITGLKYYCTNQLWKKKLIFELYKNITYFSEFGNPNRAYILDWVKVNDFTLDSYQSTWDDTYNKCTIPAVFNIDILYAGYGAVNNTQYGIYEVKYRMDYIYWYAKHIYDTTVMDNFFSYINVNFFKIPQDTVWWYAPGPGFILLPRNIMYPFRLGTTTYGSTTSSAGYLGLNYVCYFELLFFIYIFIFN